MGLQKDIAKAKGSFRLFLWLCWKHLNLPPPTPVQYDISKFLQYGPRRLIIEAFRGVGKSWITSIFVLWCLLRNPQLKILVVSASQERADAFSTFTKRLIDEMPILQHLKARSGQRDSNVAFDVGPAEAAHAPSVKSVGITGQMSGSRADLIVADDVEVPKNSFTVTMREKLSELVKEFDAVLSPGGRIVYLGTPQTEDSLYPKLESRGYEIQIWPAEYPNAILMKTYGHQIAPWIREAVEKDPSIVGKPVDPDRFSETELMERKLSYGRSGYALQFMLDTSLSDAERYPLKLSDLIIMNVDRDKAPSKVIWSNTPDCLLNDLTPVGFKGDRYYRPVWKSDLWEDYTGSVMAIDPSGRGADETTYAVLKMLRGVLYATRWGAVEGGYSTDTLTALAKIAKEQKVNEVLIESNFGDGMFAALFQPVLARYWNVTITEVNHNTQKERRIIDTLEPVMNQHRLVIDEQIVKDDLKSTEDPYKQGFWQLTRITKDRNCLPHDDRIDVLAMAVAYWVEQMSVDQDKTEENARQVALEAELARFADHVFGHQPKALNWMN